jgi:hypothetical protein
MIDPFTRDMVPHSVAFDIGIYSKCCTDVPVDEVEVVSFKYEGEGRVVFEVSEYSP